MPQLSKQPAFDLGQIVATPGALATLKKSGQQPGEFLTRHADRESPASFLLPEPRTLPMCSRSSRASNLTVFRRVSAGSTCQDGRFWGG